MRRHRRSETSIFERRKDFSTLNQQHMESQIMSVQRLENQYREIEMIAFLSSLQDRIS